MRITTFIGSTSLLLAGWLGLAFFREVPTGSYPVIEQTLVGKSASDVAKIAVAAEDDDHALEP